MAANFFHDLPLELTCLILDACSLYTWHTLRTTSHHVAWIIDQCFSRYRDRFGFSGRATLDTFTLFLHIWFPQDLLQRTPVSRLFDQFVKCSLVHTIHHERVKATTLSSLSALASTRQPTPPRHEPRLLVALFRELNMYSLDAHTHGLSAMASTNQLDLLRHKPRLLVALFRELNVCPLDVHTHNLLSLSAKLGGLYALRFVMGILNLKTVEPHWATDVLIHAAQGNQTDVVKFLFKRTLQKMTGWMTFPHRLLCSALRGTSLNLADTQEGCTVVKYLLTEAPPDMSAYSTCTGRTRDGVCARQMVVEWPLKTLLCAAIESKHLGTMQHIFSFFEPEDYKDAAPDFLMCAISTNSLDVVKFVMSKTEKQLKKVLPKSNVSNYFCFSTNMPVGQPNIVTYLEQALPQFPFRHNDATNLVTACLFGRLDTVQALLPQHSHALQNCLCALEAAADVGNLEIVHYLVKTCDLQSADLQDSQALLFAVCHGHFSVVRYLLNIMDLSAAQANARRHRLYLAAVYGLKLEILQHLIERLSPTPDDFMDSRNITQKCLAANGCTDLLKLLFERVRLTIPEIDVNSLHYAAAQGGHFETTQYLVESMGCRVDFLLLVCALHGGNMRLVSYVQAKNTDPETWKPRFLPENKVSTSQEHLSAIKYAVDLLHLTPEDARGGDNRALQTAVQWGDLDLVKYLVETMGLGPQDFSFVNHLAMKTALQRNYQHIVKYLASVSSFYSAKTLSHIRYIAIEEATNARERFASACCDLQDVDAYWGTLLSGFDVEREMDMCRGHAIDFLYTMHAITEHYFERAGLPSSHSVGCSNLTTKARPVICPHACPRIRHVRQWLSLTREPVPLHLIKRWPTSEAPFYSNHYFHNFGDDNHQRIRMP